MAGVAPEAAVHHLTLIPRISLELRQLPVAAGLEDETQEPEASAGEIEDAEGPAAGAQGSEQGQ